ncbi:hypothetical protein Syun_007384 [Stephania yunnanensis]|uniref:Uncharacterized protein n=1 Tax=Stephania yunnanensis TaxID=152371 RepID=A0AAP0KZW4_9MAGN
MARLKKRAWRPPYRVGTSTAGCQVPEGVPKRKRPTSPYRKQKNLDTKERPIKKSKFGQPDLGDGDVEGIATTFVGERDTLVRGTNESGSTRGTKTSRIPPGGPSDLSLIPSFKQHVLLDTWRNKIITQHPEKENVEKLINDSGYVQRILREPYRPIDVDRRSVTNLYNVKYSYEAQFWEDWKGHLESVERCGEKAKYLYQAAPDYMGCFHKISHPFAVNPKHVSGVVHEDENLLRFWCMDRDNVIVANVFNMADHFIAFLSRVDDTYKPSGLPLKVKE